MALASALAGAFITFEGIDGSGKSTVVSSLAEWLRDAGLDVVVTREPGGTQIAEEIRAIILAPASIDMQPETETLLFSAARAEHVAKLISPALDRGAVVLCDRFADSTLAYQWGGRGLSRSLVEAAQALATGGLRPNLTLLLDLPVEDALARRRSEGVSVNRLDREAVAFYQRVRDAYLLLADGEPARWRIVDAQREQQHVIKDVIGMIDASGCLPGRVHPSSGVSGVRGTG